MPIRRIHSEAHPTLRRMGGSMPLGAAVLAVALCFVAASSAAAAQEQEPNQSLPPELLAGGKIFLKNDLQAWGDAMLVFRGFRREVRRIDRFEEVDSEEEADLIGVLSGDPNVVDSQRIDIGAIPYPSGYTSSKVMLLVVFTAEGNRMLWFDAVDWDTTGNVTRVDSHERLARRLRAALDDAGRASSLHPAAHDATTSR